MSLIVLVSEGPDISLVGSMMIAQEAVGLKRLAILRNVASTGVTVAADDMMLAADDFVAFGRGHAARTVIFY